MKMKLLSASVCLFSAVAVFLTGCGNNSEIEKMQQQIDTLQQYIEVNLNADIENWDGSYVGFGDLTVHTIYDDTPLIEAAKNNDTSALTEEERFTLDTAQNIIAQLGITDSMSDYEKEKAIYDWQVKYVGYDSTEQSALPENIDDYNYTPYGVLKYGQAICVGNATTFKLFMDLLDIDCKIIHSTTQGEHAWNLVKLDGEWYHVDVTFDYSTSGEPAYTYFNVTDTVKQNAGYPWDASEFPAATATKYCMAVMENTELKDVYALPQAIRTAVDEEKSSLYVSFQDYSSIDYSMLDQIGAYIGGGYLILGQSYPTEDGTVIYNIRIEPPYAEPVEDDSCSYDYDKMQKAIEETFGKQIFG